MSTHKSSLENPFPGLRPFEVDENHLFFGREEKVQGLQDKLNKARFLAVMGPSGSGKSSLVRSGLISKLTASEEAGNWRIVRCHPGNDPTQKLAQGLLRPGPRGSGPMYGEGAGNPSEADLVTTLEQGAQGLVTAIKQAGLDEDTRVLLLVDQFEELFRFAETERSRKPHERKSQAFIDLLLAAKEQQDIPIYIILTMRSDFLEDCTIFEGLPEAINEGQYLIPRMTRDELGMAIRGPIELQGAKVSSDLVDQLHQDMQEQNDMLPLMQHTMMRTWDYWASLDKPDMPIGLVHYDHVGTLHKALSNHADEIYDELNSDRLRLVCERIFKSLTEKSAEHKEGIRRPMHLGDLAKEVDASVAEVIEVVDAFRGRGRSLLMPPPQFSLQESTVVDISHESLMRIWQRLVRWSLEEREKAHRYNNIVTRVHMWKSPGGGSLMSDPELSDTLAWQIDKEVNAAWAGRYGDDFTLVGEYLAESKEADKKAVVFVRRSHRNRIAALVFAILVLLAIPLSWWLLQGRRDAEETAGLMEEERDEVMAELDSALQEVAEAREQMAIAAAQAFEDQGDSVAVVAAVNRADSLSVLIALLQRQIEAEASKVEEEQEKSARLRDSIVTIYGEALEKSEAEIAGLLYETEREKALADAEVMAKQGYQLLQRNQVQQGKELALAAYDSIQAYDGPEMNAAVFQALTEAYVSVSRPGDYEVNVPLTAWPVGGFHKESQRLAVSTGSFGVKVSSSIEPFQFDEEISLEDVAIGISWSAEGKYVIAGGRRFLYRIDPETKEISSIRIRGLGRRGIFFIQSIEVNDEEFLIFATDVAVAVVPLAGFDEERDILNVFEPEMGDFVRQLQTGPNGDVWLATDHRLIQLGWARKEGESRMKPVREVNLDDLHSINVDMDFDALAVSENNVAIGTTTGDMWLIPKEEIDTRSSARLSIYRHQLHRDGITHLEFDASGSRLLSTSFDNNAKLVLVEEGKVRLQEINLFHKDKVWWGSFCGDYMVTLHGTEGVRRWFSSPSDLVKVLQ